MNNRNIVANIGLKIVIWSTDNIKIDNIKIEQRINFCSSRNKCKECANTQFHPIKIYIIDVHMILFMIIEWRVFTQINSIEVFFCLLAAVSYFYTSITYGVTNASVINH